MSTATQQIGVPMDNDTYHASPGVSNSKLKVFMDDVRDYYYQFLSGEYVAKPKSCFDFGSAVHDICLLGSQANIVAIPSSVLSKSGSKAGGAWKDFEAENAGKLLLKHDEYMAVLRCVDAVAKHPVASKLLYAQGPTEHAFSYDDETLGLTLRCKVDKLCLLPAGNVVMDLKTTGTGTKSEKFVKSVASFKYANQEYFYKKVLEANSVNIASFVFVAVSIDQPHTVDCYTLSSEFLEIAETDVENALLDLAERTRANDWLARNHDSIIELSPPNWMKYRHDYDT
ncbi:MAG: PD-(D/E)XK nuclease-like domain-containing protein [Pirellulaceae bacterium]|nr:PD-(D/E)XK nuclease-like domain-containing protein [Pirellulaceae bacterium]